MPKYLTDDEVKDLRRKGKIPHVVPKSTPKDLSVQAIEGIGRALSDHLKVQERQTSAIREEIISVLEVVKASDGRPVKVEYIGEGSPNEWQEIDITVIRNSEDFISKLKLKKVK